jgi:hypothetical protein
MRATRTPKVDDVSPRVWPPPEETNIGDRSYLLIMAWAVGLLLVGLALFRFDGSEPATVAASAPSNPAAALEANAQAPESEMPIADGTETGTPKPASPINSIAPSQLDKSKLSLVYRRGATVIGDETESIAGYFRNDSDRLVRKWKGVATFKNIAGEPFDQVKFLSSEPVPPHTQRPFKFKHRRTQSTKTISWQVTQVEFER